MEKKEKLRKFPSLYNIIKKDDDVTLTEYFEVNPYENLYDGPLKTCTCYTLYYHSIELGSINCFMNLTNRLNLDSLKEYASTVVSYYKNHPKIFDYYYAIAKMLSQEQNNYECMNKIVLSILDNSLKIYKELFDRVIKDYNFVEQFQNNIFRKNLENVIIKNKSLWITYFEKFNRNNNINRNNLFAKCLIFTKFDNKKYLELFNNMNYSDKIKIEDNERNDYNYYYTTRHEYSLEFIICVTCKIDDYSKFNIMKEKTFEEELINLFDETINKGENYNNFFVLKEGKNIVFNNLLIFINERKWYHQYIIEEENYEKILKLVPYMTEKMIEILEKELMFKDFDVEKFLKENSSYYVKPYYVQNSRNLLNLIKEEYKKNLQVKILTLKKMYV